MPGHAIFLSSHTDSEPRAFRALLKTGPDRHLSRALRQDVAP